jgi:hypothetical protein
MTKLAVTFVLFTLVAGGVAAAEPGASGPPFKTRPTAPSRTGSYFERAAVGLEYKRQTVRLVVKLALPQPQIGQFAWALSDPNYRMTQLLYESEDLRQAREEFHRFWMNNQPSTLSSERLKGAIGP